MDRFFRAVSFAAGGTPGYERLHDLFTPVGRLINAIGDAPDDTTVAGFAEPRRALVDAGVLTSFEEVETDAVTESFGKVAHRFSTYEKRFSRVMAAMPQPSARTTSPVQHSHRLLVRALSRRELPWTTGRADAGANRAATLANETTSPGCSSRGAETTAPPTKVPPEEPRSVMKTVFPRHPR